jgi:uncharacterized protein (TIGR03086 family)
MDVVDALVTSYGNAAKVIAGLSPDQLGQPSPCAEWDVRAALNHTLGATWMFTLANQGQAAGEDAGDLVGDDPQAALSEAAAANLASWRQPGAFEGERTFPFGTFPAPAAALLNLEEIVVHTWDIATAIGQDTTIDPTIAEMLYEFLGAIPLDPYRAHGAFGREVTVASTAPVAQRLLGLLGRQPC